MCKCGNHEICLNTKYKTIDTVRTVAGLVGVVLISTGQAVMSSVDVVVGKVPFAWFVGFIVSIAGLASCLVIATIDMKNRWYRLSLSVLLVAAGVYNIIDNPRAAVICPCPPGYYGSDSSGFLDKCQPCRCGNGTCMETVYGDGSCICPPRYDPDTLQNGEACTLCIEGAEGDQCERCKIGWKYPHCEECYPGYEGPPCDFTATGAITHKCKDGWVTECVEDYDPLPPWTPDKITPCSENRISARTVRCDRCADGYNGRYCTPCPNCTQHDPGGKCVGNLNRTLLPTLSSIPCYDDYNCSSFHCVDNSACASEIRERTSCSCTAGFAGPICEPCVDYTVDVGETCVKGTCLYNPVIKKPYCFCASTHIAPAGICSKNVNGECEPGYWGSNCERCDCGNGICDDGKEGNGKCKSCYYSEWIYSGMGMWTGDRCRQCGPGREKVGCGRQCLPTPEYQVTFSLSGESGSMVGKSTWNNDECGEVQRCTRNGIGPCLSDCLNGTLGEEECPTTEVGKSTVLKTYKCELTSGSNWYKCTKKPPCSLDPCIHGTCTESGAEFNCDCDNGWSGETCSVDIDECASNPCSSNAVCANNDGGFSCTCKTGYSGDGINCTDINECASNPCSSNAVCANNEGGFYCTCNSGYSGDGVTCTDIDECASTPCSSNAVCANNEGGFSCTCNSGYSGDGVTCTDINECAGCQNGNCVNGNCECDIGWCCDNCGVILDINTNSTECTCECNDGGCQLSDYPSYDGGVIDDSGGTLDVVHH